MRSADRNIWRMAVFNKGFGMHRRGRLAGVMLLALMTSACGGGGGVNSTPTPPSPITQPDPPVAPTPTPPAPVVPPTVNYNDAEYARSNAAFAADALTAYNAGATGAGVKIAVLDSGLTDPSGQFTGRIDPASRDMVGNRGITDPDGHGTSVTAVAAAGRNGSDILGVAFNATVIALRTDDIGSCASSNGCAHDDSVLAQGVDLARQSGARVINMSLGGSPASRALVAAIGRATAAGVIIVISAGNDATANPDPLAQVANTAQANGLVIIAGSHGTQNDTYAISDFSNRAGSFGQYYLTALGYRVRAFDQTGGAFLFSGTSYSAPAIAGAVALLAQAFPNLTGRRSSTC
jgi:subtilisin family serine protease